MDHLVFVTSTNKTLRKYCVDSDSITMNWLVDAYTFTTVAPVGYFNTLTVGLLFPKFGNNRPTVIVSLANSW